MRGLSQSEVADRVARGETNATRRTTSRPLWHIVRDNVLTLFNAILTVCFVLIALFGDLRDGLFYAMGYSGHGTQMSVHMGQIMARVMGGEVDANPLAGLDWPVVPGHFGPPWFLPLVGAYYRFQDWRS